MVSLLCSMSGNSVKCLWLQPDVDKSDTNSQHNLQILWHLIYTHTHTESIPGFTQNTQYCAHRYVTGSWCLFLKFVVVELFLLTYCWYQAALPTMVNTTLALTVAVLRHLESLLSSQNVLLCNLFVPFRKK